MSKWLKLSLDMSKKIAEQYQLSIHASMIRDAWEWLRNDCDYTDTMIEAIDAYQMVFGVIPRYIDKVRLQYT